MTAPNPKLVLWTLGTAAELPQLLEGLSRFAHIESFPSFSALDQHASPFRPDALLLVLDGQRSPESMLEQARKQVGVPIVLLCRTESDAPMEEALLAGVAGIVFLPAAPETVVFAVRKALQHSRSHGDADGATQGTTITVFSPKGGTGKSVIATNLAVAIVRHGRQRTLLVDLDLQFGDAAIMLGLAPQRTVLELLGDGIDLDAERLDVYSSRHPSGLTLLPAPRHPEEADLITGDSITELLDVARSAYDTVVVDTAPFFHGPMLAAIDRTDSLLLICSPDVPTLKNVRLALETLKQLSFPNERIRVVLNRAGGKGSITADEAAIALDRNVDIVLPLDAEVPLAVNRGVPAVLAAPRSPFARALAEMMLELIPAHSATLRQRPRQRLLALGRR